MSNLFYLTYMSHIRAEINQIFNNSKVGDLYSNSYGGDDMIYIELERNFSFNEIYEIIQVFPQGNYLSFLSKHEDSHGLSEFFKKFEKRCEEIYTFYDEKKSTEYLNEMLEQNQGSICKKYPQLSELDAKMKYASYYLKKHKQIYNNTYEQSRNFLNNPSAYL